MQRQAEANLRSAQTTLHGDSATAPAPLRQGTTAEPPRPFLKALFIVKAPFHF